MDGLEDRKRELDQIAGWIVPIMSDDPIPGRRQRHALAPDDFYRVVYGYACSECLAKFNEYRVRCPACGFTRDVGQDLATPPPQEWVDHLKARKFAEENPVKTKTPSMDSLIDSIMKDPEVEHTTISKLKKRSGG